MGSRRVAAARGTREALLDAGVAVAAEYGLSGLSVNRVVAAADVAKGTFYVHFTGRADFIDAVHARFHERVREAMGEATAGLPRGAEAVLRAAEAYLDACLSDRAVKALALESRSDPVAGRSMAARHEAFVAAAVPDLEALGWEDAEAAAQLLVAMIAEIAIRELDAGRPIRGLRRALRAFVDHSPR